MDVLRRKRARTDARTPILFDELEPRRLLALAFDVLPINPIADPTAITVGPDKNLWFSAPFGGTAGAEIGQINPTSGAVVEFPTSSIESNPISIVSGPGGDLWFIDGRPPDYNLIASVDPTTHLITDFSVPIPGVSLGDMTVGTDNNLWFTDQSNSAIGVFNTVTHQATEFPLPQATDVPSTIALGPDGNLWFGVTEFSTHAIGDINPKTHAITLTALPTARAMPGTITSGSDGNVWFNEVITGADGAFTTQVATVNTNTHLVSEFSGGGDGGITSGPDGNIWYSSDGAFAYVGEINVATHVSSTYNLPAGATGPNNVTSLVTGPDGNLWITVPGYVIKASIIPSTQSAIAGYVYLDPSGGGTSAGGPLYAQTVFLDLKDDGQLDAGDPVANTNPFGYYNFTGLTPGAYTVRVVPYAGSIATYPTGSGQSVTVTGGQLGSPSSLGLLPTTSLLPLTYDPTPFGTNNTDLQTAEVNGLYNLILHRAPDATGGASAVAYLKNGGSVGQLAADLLTSAEYETNVVASYYQNYLRRTGSSSEIAAWVNLMQNGLTEEQVAADFLNSAEYSLLFPANASFVQALYGDVLGRLPASSEVAAWVNLLNQGVTRSQVISAFISTPESDIRGVEGLYGIIFARAADSNGQSAAVSALQSGVTLVQLATGLFGSAEFTARANATVG